MSYRHASQRSSTTSFHPRAQADPGRMRAAFRMRSSSSFTLAANRTTVPAFMEMTLPFSALSSTGGKWACLPAWGRSWWRNGKTWVRCSGNGEWRMPPWAKRVWRRPPWPHSHGSGRTGVETQPFDRRWGGSLSTVVAAANVRRHVCAHLVSLIGLPDLLRWFLSSKSDTNLWTQGDVDLIGNLRKRLGYFTVIVVQATPSWLVS